jgi:hypothetical protein
MIDKYKIAGTLATMSADQLTSFYFPGLAVAESATAASMAEQRQQSPAERMAAAMSMQADAKAGKLTMATDYPSAIKPLVSLLAAEYIDTTEEVLAPLANITTVVAPEVSPSRMGQQPTIGVPVNLGGNTTQVNPSTFGANASGSGWLANVTCNQLVTETQITSVELRNFGTVQDRIGSAVRAHGEAILQQFAAVIAAAAPTATTSAGATTAPVQGSVSSGVLTAGKVGRIVLQNGTVTGPQALSPEWIARTASGLFRAMPDLLLLNPQAYGAVIPQNKLSFGDPTGIPEGTYGIRHIHRVAPFPELDNGTGFTAFGALMRRNAVVMASGTPYTAEQQGYVDWQPLGNMYGVDLWLSTWFDYNTRTFKLAVESLVGFQLTNPAGCYLLSSAVA